MENITALRAAADQEVVFFEEALDRYINSLLNNNSGRTDKISTAIRMVNEHISHNRLAILFAISAVKNAEMKNKLAEMEDKLAEMDFELKYWSNR